MSRRRDDEEGSTLEEWETRDSGPVPLPPARRRSRVGQVQTGTQNRAEVGKDIAAARTPNQVSIEDVAHECAQLVHQATSAGPLDEEAVLELYLARLGAMFGGRRLVVRIARGRGRVELVRSTAPVASEGREQQRISEDALQAGGLEEADAHHAGFAVVDAYRNDFDEGAAGFDIALVDTGRLLGTMGVEYQPGIEPPALDATIFRILGAQLSLALGRARLREEASYLSGYLASLLEHANVPLLVLDRQARVQIVSRAFLHLVGRGRNDVLHQDLTDLVVESSRPPLLQAILLGLREGEVANVDLELDAADGSPLSAMLELVAILGPEEEVEALLVITRDVTALRRLEEQIVQAEKLATLGQLAAGVVHELNNPLTSISVYAERLHRKAQEDPNADPSDVERLARIVQAADRILRFTGELVTYARPTTQPPKPLVAGEVVEQALVFCEHIVRDAAAGVHLDFAEGLPTILGVRGQLHQVFINLITNACQAMPHGAGELRISAETVNSRAIAIHVKDNGSGIAADQQDSIFEPFFSTKGEGEGTGLGLSIVRNIVQQHGGTIEVSSEVGDGTCFTVVLPAAETPS